MRENFVKKSQNKRIFHQKITKNRNLPKDRERIANFVKRLQNCKYYQKIKKTQILSKDPETIQISSKDR